MSAARASEPIGEIAHRDRLRARRNGTNGTAALLPVELVTATMDRKPSDTTEHEFVVRLRSGRELRVRRGFDAGELRRLVEVLEAC